MIIEPGKLKCLGDDLQSLCDEMRDTKSKILLGGQPAIEIALSTLNVEDELTAEFAEDIRSIPELLILCHSSAIPVENGSADLALMVVRPQQGRYRLFPQDWFNHSGADFGYEWVTRVVRNPETGHIHGEGFRIRAFVLDDSLRNLQQ